MSVTPFLDASLMIQIHAIAAMEVLVLGVYLLSARKGGKWHRILGYVWVVNMFVAATSSFFIHQTRLIGPFSPIHGLSAWALYSLYVAIGHARAGRIAAHRGNMRGLYLGGAVVAGVLAFMPGRVFNRMLFGAHEDIGFMLVLGLALIGTGLYLMRGRLRRARTTRHAASRQALPMRMPAAKTSAPPSTT